MKRSRLSPQSAKRRAAVKANAAAMGEYCETHLRCGCCWLPAHKAYGPDRMLDVHHLAGRGRFHDVAGNFLVLCRRCHDQFHSGGRFDDITGDRLPELTAGMLLGCKREADALDEALIASLKNWKALPANWEPCPLPAVYLLERERNS